MKLQVARIMATQVVSQEMLEVPDRIAMEIQV